MTVTKYTRRQNVWLIHSNSILGHKSLILLSGHKFY